jgi:Winged helix DNA-binding domain
MPGTAHRPGRRGEIVQISRANVLRFRVHAQELDARRARVDSAILDLGVQDTGSGGAAWSLANRRHRGDPGELVLVWTLRGAPHYYRRADIAGVAAATAPFSEADAGKRVFDASKPLKAAGISTLEGLARIAQEMRDIVAEPTVKGDVSTELSRRLPAPYLRDCVPCAARHTYEQPFRLSALPAGLELEPGTSPPVLRRITGWRGAARRVPQHLDPIRGVLRFLGPATPKLVAGCLDAPVREIAARWPQDVEPVEVDGVRLDVLAADASALRHPPAADGVRLLGPFDLFLQGRDRELVVPDGAARKDLWRTLGRPGAVLDGHEVVGSWRPRASGRKLRLAVSIWSGDQPPRGLDEQAQRLADLRGQEFAGVVTD